MTRWQRCISFFAKRKAKANLRSYCQDTPSKNNELFPFSLYRLNLQSWVRDTPAILLVSLGENHEHIKTPTVGDWAYFFPKDMKIHSFFLEKNEQFFNKGGVFFPSRCCQGTKSG